MDLFEQIRDEAFNDELEKIARDMKGYELALKSADEVYTKKSDALGKKHPYGQAASYASAVGLVGGSGAVGYGVANKLSRKGHPGAAIILGSLASLGALIGGGYGMGKLHQKYNPYAKKNLPNIKKFLKDEDAAGKKYLGR